MTLNLPPRKGLPLVHVPAQVVQGQVVQGGTTQGLPPNFPPTQGQASPGTSIAIMKVLYLVMETIYSCQSCGGMCQIKEDMKTDGQVVLTRLQDDEGVVKRCPYCNTTATFYKVTRGLI